MRIRPPFRPHPDGLYVELEAAEAELLGRVPEMLEGLGDPSVDPAAARLSPVAHPDDPHAEAEFRRLTGPELDRARRADRRAFADTLVEAPGGVVLATAQAEAWLRVLGEARLALASRLGIENEGWEETAGDDPAHAVLRYLSWLQEELTEALAGGLDEAQG